MADGGGARQLLRGAEEGECRGRAAAGRWADGLTDSLLARCGDAVLCVGRELGYPHCAVSQVWEGTVQEFDTTDEPIVRQFASGSLDGPIIYL